MKLKVLGRSRDTRDPYGYIMNINIVGTSGLVLTLIQISLREGIGIN